MDTKYFFAVIICVTSILIGTSYGAKITWTNGEPNDWNWTQANNWDIGQVPTSADRAHLSKKGYEDRCIIDSSMSAKCDEILLGKSYGPSYLVMTGGTLDVGTYNNAHIGAWSDGHGVLEMSGGTITIAKALFLAARDNSIGEIHMTGGTIDVNFDLYVPGWWNGSGVSGIINLDGGEIICRTLYMDFGNKGHIDITDGRLTLDGYKRTAIEDFQEQGLISAFDGDPRAELIIVEDGTNTFVTAYRTPDELAYDPYPANNSLITSLDGPVTLTWRDGKYVGATDKHDVYFGTTYEDVNDADTGTVGIYFGRQDANSFGPITLELGESYYWRIDEVNQSTSDLWKGIVWSFEVPYISVEDMEDYDTTTNPIGDTWLASGGAGVSIEEDPDSIFIHNGDKSLKFDFSGNSSIERDFAAGNDWTVGNAKVVGLSFKASEGNTGGPLSLTLTDADGDPSATLDYPDSSQLDPNIGGYDWNFWAIDIQDLAAVDFDMNKVLSIKLTLNGSGTIYMDDIRLYGQICTESKAPAGDFTGECVIDANDLSVLTANWLESGKDVYASAPDDNHLQVYYKFDETSGWDVTDYSGNGRDATATTSIGWSPDGYDGSGCIDLYLAGMAYQVNGPSSVFSGIEDEVTFSIWVKGDEVVPGGGQVLKGKSANGTWALGAYVPVSTGDEAQFSIGYDPNALTGYDTVEWDEITPTDWKGDWVHYAFVKDAVEGTQSIYRNGVLVARATDAYVPVNLSEWQIANAYEGKIDEFKVYDYALTQEEIIHLAGLTQVYQPLMIKDPVDNNLIDLADLAALAENWALEVLWP